MSEYSEFFLNSPSSVVNLETVEITHPSFSQDYSIVRNSMNGLTATLETGASKVFTYYPLAISQTGSSDDLDQSLKVSLGDVGQIIPQEIDRCVAAGTMGTRPVLTARNFRSDDLSAPIDGPYIFEITTTTSQKAQTTFTAGAPRLNLNQTGEAYRLDRFPMLRAAL